MANPTGTDMYNTNFGHALSPEQTIRAGAIRRVAAELHDTIVIELPEDTLERKNILIHLYSVVRESIRTVASSH
jgi:hypothetical protein